MKKINSTQKWLLFFLFFSFYFKNLYGISLLPASIPFIAFVTYKALTSRLYFNFLLPSLIFIFFILISLFSSWINNIDYADSAIWFFPFFIFIIFTYSAENLKIKTSDFIFSSKIIASTHLMFILMRWSNDEYLNSLYIKLIIESPGFFNFKEILAGLIVPVTYFESTLCLVFLGVLCLFENHFRTFAIIFTVVLLSPSRFGSAVLIIFAIWAFLEKHELKAFILPLIVLSFLILLFTISWHNDQRASYVIDLFKNQDLGIMELFFGFGPGAFFYSSHLDEYVNNLEIFYLSHLMRFGLISTILLISFMTYIVFRLHRTGLRSFSYAIGAHFLVSFSNPVLTWYPFLFFLGWCLNHQFKKTRRLRQT